MYHVRKIMFLTCILTCLGLLVSCASKRVQSTSNESTSSSSLNTISREGIFELNGSSDSGNAGGLNTVYFDYNSSTLRTDSKKILANNAKILKENSTVSILLEGHCDERGGTQYNLALGEKRARAIQAFLTGLGVKRGNLSIQSFGKERPVAFGHDEDSWSQNRRVNFVVLEK